jgi:hypothetical protein
MRAACRRIPVIFFIHPPQFFQGRERWSRFDALVDMLESRKQLSFRSGTVTLKNNEPSEACRDNLNIFLHFPEHNKR